YDLSDEDNARVYDAFKRVASKKHFVGTRELDAIVASTALQVPSTYRLESYVINSGNVITATANLLVELDGEELRGVGVGDGPIDAAFSAIEQIIGHHYELDDFQIQTVTEGRDAMGSALVKIRADGKVYSGSGISTDIIGASIRAYISALNKIVYDEA
ncbi:MAG: 2-isopropylmalate synthase, partial [Clostridia bacterium]|nr:2-isopropylmalate synthase [Clostridia bacterium]